MFNKPLFNKPLLNKPLLDNPLLDNPLLDIPLFDSPIYSGQEADESAAATYTAGPRPASPKQPISAWQRWEMGSFEAPYEEFATTPDAEVLLAKLTPPLLIDEAELSRLREEAQQAGASAGHAEGYSAGQEQGYAAGQAVAAQEAAALRKLSLALPEALRQADHEVADALLALALDIARQLVGQALTVEPELILVTVRELLQTEPALSGTPRLLLHPDDMALVQQYLNDDLQTAGWLLRADPSLTRGDCRVHASSGELDATLATRWQRVTAALGLNHD